MLSLWLSGMGRHKVFPKNALSLQLSDIHALAFLQSADDYNKATADFCLAFVDSTDCLLRWLLVNECGVRPSDPVRR